LAAEAHLAEFTVSLTHESMMAVAIVMATVREPVRIATQPEPTSEQRKA
jgi:hypothetical protein